MTIKWNNLAWNNLTMEQSDRILVQEKNGAFHRLKGCTTVERFKCCRSKIKFSLKWLQLRLVPNCHCLLALHDNVLENQNGNQPRLKPF